MKRFLLYVMLFALIFSSLSIFATEIDTGNTGNGGNVGDIDNTGNTGNTANIGNTGNTGEMPITPSEEPTTTLTVENASFSLVKNSTLNESLPSIEGETDLQYVIVTQPTNGTLVHSNETSNSFSYTPDTDYVGNDSFTFKIIKGEQESNVSTVSLSITEPEVVEPETLTISDVTFNLEENTILAANLPTIEGESELVYVIVSEPTHGTLVHSDETTPGFSYTPSLDYIGNDSFTFKVTKGELESNIATVTLIIEKAKEPIIPFNYIDMQDHWANYSASHLAARGLIIGEEIGSRYYFYPNNKMTRSEFMLFLLAITESNEDATLAIPKILFADSDTTPDWLIEAAKLAYAKGIIKGSAKGNNIYLNAYAPLTRTEAAVMVNNVLKPTNSTDSLDYSDFYAIPEWGIQAIRNLTSYQILQGSGNQFNPNSIVSRGEAAEMCFKLVKQLEKDALSSNTDDLDIK